jgi:hypothetical protein
VSYAFDPATGNFERQPSTFGQVYLDRADTLGAKRLNVQFLYEYVKLDELSGEDASDLRDPTPICVPGKAAAIRSPNLGVKAVQHQFLFALTYGTPRTSKPPWRFRSCTTSSTPAPGWRPSVSCRTARSCRSARRSKTPRAPFGVGDDLSVGGRGSVWRDTVFAFVNVVLPLNDGFVRTDPIPVIGVEATF